MPLLVPAVVALTPVASSAGASLSASTSAEGSLTVFTSTAANLVAAQTDTNNAGDVFPYDRPTGTVTIAWHRPAATTTTGGGHSRNPLISDDGASVGFPSSVPDLVAGADVAVFRPRTGAWYLRTATPHSIPWGTSGDVPVPGDYDGDESVELAVFRPSGGGWFVRSAAPLSPVWGTGGGIPVPLPAAVHDPYF